MSGPEPIVVAGDEALADFRGGLTGPYALDLLHQAGGHLLVQLAVGAGKTAWMTRIITYALQCDNKYDLVVVLLPRWDILHEVRLRLPIDLPSIVLYPRPRKRCGDLDSEWQLFEQHGCGQLGRENLCKLCPRRRRCFWPEQYGQGLRETRLILATQQHLALDPFFISRLRRLTLAHRPLVLLDESDLLLRPCKRTIRQADLTKFISAQRAVVEGDFEPNTNVNSWLEMSSLFAQASEVDLREGRWVFPSPGTDWSLAVQQHGQRLFGTSFNFLAFDLRHFGRSDPASRERRPDGGVHFAVPPYLGQDYMIFSGSIAPELARYRLDPNHTGTELASPFKHYRFEHPATRWYNLAMRAGAAEYFRSNAPVILDFFASLIARNVVAGKRTLLVARKKFLSLCAEYLRERLAELGFRVKIVTSDWAKQKLDDPQTLPLIPYGTVGINRFEHHDAAYCLTGFYTNATALAETVQEIDPTTERFRIDIRSTGRPPRRSVHVQLPDGRRTILPTIASQALIQREADVVVQAVGRVRPFTRPREIITFQMSDLPGVAYDHEFCTLDAARQHFGVQTPFMVALQSRRERARQLHGSNWSISAIARELHVSRSTVKRYIRNQGRVT